LPSICVMLDLAYTLKGQSFVHSCGFLSGLQLFVVCSLLHGTLGRNFYVLLVAALHSQ
jgi:hypothetical protein